MTIKTIGFTKTFPNGLYWEKVMMEADLMPDDDPKKCLYELKKQVEEFFYESNASAKKQAAISESNEYVTEPTTDDQPLPNMIDQINSCTDITVLKTYKLLVRNNPEWQTAYLNKIIELTPKQ